jgi:hypothetical protein
VTTLEHRPRINGHPHALTHEPGHEPTDEPVHEHAHDDVHGCIYGTADQPDPAASPAAPAPQPYGANTGTDTRNGNPNGSGNGSADGSRDTASDAAGTALRRVRLTPATDIVLRPTYWLWDQRIPTGSIVLGPGREGIGKSLFCAWLTARVTTGTLPGIHHGSPRAVVYAATEDSWERTIAGRLIAAGSDMARVFRVDVDHLAGHTVPLSLPKDCDGLAVEITAHDVALLILDPLISAVDSGIDVNSEKLRDALEPLAKMADQTGAAVFGLAHFNKASSGDVLSRITGSRAFAAVARAAIAFARDPNADDGSCVISQAKNNLGPLDMPSLRYVVEPVTLDTPEGPAQWGRLRITGETTVHVEELLHDAENSTGDRGELHEAMAWLRDYLTTHTQPPSPEVKKAAQAAGISVSTLQRARSKLGVTTKLEGFPRTSRWSLP